MGWVQTQNTQVLRTLLPAMELLGKQSKDVLVLQARCLDAQDRSGLLTACLSLPPATGCLLR